MLSIALGGSIGAVLRYITAQWFNSHLLIFKVIPIGTFAVNIIGSFCIGFLYPLLDSLAVSKDIKAFVFVGLLGAFTTFSTFSYENMQLLKSGEYVQAFMYVFFSNLVGISLAFAGYFIGKSIV